MGDRGVVPCLLAAVLFGVTAPLTSELAGSLPAFTLAVDHAVGARRPPARCSACAAHQVVAVLLAAAGIVVSARPIHVHEHRHDLLVHSHPHVSGLHHRATLR